MPESCFKEIFRINNGNREKDLIIDLDRASIPPFSKRDGLFFNVDEVQGAFGKLIV